MTHPRPDPESFPGSCTDGILPATIKPGIYLLDIGGIRIKRVYRVTPDGDERLGDLSTNLEAMIVE
jgi:hypothetical protein